MTADAAPLLQVKNLVAHFFTPEGMVRAVDGFSLRIGAGETVAVVGESGCGKSVMAMSVLRLAGGPRDRIAGRILFRGRDLLTLPEPAMRRVRGKEIGMIFQEPMTSRNPVLTVGRQIGETLRLHEGLTARQAARRAVEMLALVGIPAPARWAGGYPHQLSGGMRQRVMIGMVLACNPALLIADEPTTALDVTIQAQILDLLQLWAGAGRRGSCPAWRASPVGTGAGVHRLPGCGVPCHATCKPIINRAWQPAAPCNGPG